LRTKYSTLELSVSPVVLLRVAALIWRQQQRSSGFMQPGDWRAPRYSPPPFTCLH